MKHLKLYEQYSKTIFKWKNIQKVDEKIYVNVYQLLEEMYNSIIDTTDSEIVEKKEKEYINLISKLFKGNVITFEPNDSYNTYDDKVTGICDRVTYFSPPDILNDDDDVNYTFAIDSIGLFLKYDEDYNEYILSNDDDLVVVHMDIDPKIYKMMKQYNL